MYNPEIASPNQKDNDICCDGVYEKHRHRHQRYVLLAKTPLIQKENNIMSECKKSNKITSKLHLYQQIIIANNSVYHYTVNNCKSGLSFLQK